MSLKKEATQLMLALLQKEQEIEVSAALKHIAREVIKVPEKPKDYNPAFKIASRKILVLVTGGLDSSYIYFDAVAKFSSQIPVIPLYVDFGQPYVQKETQALKEMQIPYTVEVVRELQLFHQYGGAQHYWKHIIPARNLLMLLIAAEHIDCGGAIMFGAVNGEMPQTGGDKSQRFINYMQDLLGVLPNGIEIIVPLADLTKTDIVFQMACKFPGNVEHTVSCFDPQPGHCGACQACLRKWIAFTNNGLKLETRVPIYNGCTEYIAKYRKLMKYALDNEDFSKYSKRRCEQTLQALLTLEIS